MRYFWIVMSLFLVGIAASASAQGPAGATGDWRGTMVAGELKLRVALHIGDVLTFDIPDKGARGLPAKVAAIKGRTLVIDLVGLGQFDGAVSADGKLLEGTLKQGPAALPIRFERGVFTAAARPQTPLPPFPYREEDTSFLNSRQPHVRLAGTLTLPAAGDAFPAVILIGGSGAQDRDGTVFEHKTLLVLADALTRRGLAVLRLDDRGMGGSTAGPASATTADFMTDFQSGMEWLRKRKDIDPGNIGLIGISEGAIIAAAMASEDPGLAFLVLLSAQGVSGRDLIVEQARAVALASGATAGAANEAASLQAEILDAVLTASGRASLLSSLDEIARRNGRPPFAAAEIGPIASPWYRHFLTLDPSRALRKVGTPVLALLGDKDAQVPAGQNAPALRSALSGNAEASVEVLPGINHLLQAARTGSPAEYGEIEETIAPAALKRIVDWAVNHARPVPPLPSPLNAR